MQLSFHRCYFYCSYLCNSVRIKNQKVTFGKNAVIESFFYWVILFALQKQNSTRKCPFSFSLGFHFPSSFLSLIFNLVDLLRENWTMKGSISIQVANLIRKKKYLEKFPSFMAGRTLISLRYVQRSRHTFQLMQELFVNVFHVLVQT